MELSGIDNDIIAAWKPKKVFGSIEVLNIVLVPIANGIEEMETAIIISVLRRAGAVVSVASIEIDLQIHASRNMKLEADVLIGACDKESYDLIVLPGGIRGSERLHDNSILKEITLVHAKNKRLLGAISTSPTIILEAWGVLKGLKATCHPLFQGNLSSSKLSDHRVVTDGFVTTSRGPGTAIEFALSLVEQLFDELLVKEIFKHMVMRCPNAEDSFKEEYDLQYWTIGFHHDPFTVLVPIANGSEEIEITIIVDVLRRAGVNVMVASVENELKIIGSRNLKIMADKLLEDVLGFKFDIVILPGGVPGTVRLSKSQPLLKLLQQQMDEKRIYAAICAAPVIVLQKHGFLEGKKATTHPSLTHLLKDQSAAKCRIVIDGLVATSQGPGTTMEFVLAIVEKIFGCDRSLSIARSMVFPYA